MEQAIALFQQECPKRARKFLAYIEKHRHRLVDYELLQTEHHISIGSGAVESAIKQIDRRLKISGARREGRTRQLMVNHLSRIVGDTASRREASAKAYRFAYPLGHIL